MQRQQKKAEAAGVQRWRWLLVVTIGATVAVLSMLVNLGISGLNVAKIRATESLIYSRGIGNLQSHDIFDDACK